MVASTIPKSPIHHGNRNAYQVLRVIAGGVEGYEYCSSDLIHKYSKPDFPDPD
jgi:hypothetical protein